jgi:hypothetical protein
MLLFLKASLLTSFFLVVLTSAAAVPVPINNADQVVEVIPGRGLPSLASLNLTSADLFDPDFKPGIVHALSGPIST